jgi:Tfp pilus assembly protein PilV
MVSKSTRRSQQGGFSLVEAMMALLIFGVGTIMLMQLAPKASQYANHGRKLSEANGLAQGLVEELRALPTNDALLQAGTYTDSTQAGFVRTWQVLDNNPINGMKRVEVTVSFETLRPDSAATVITYF